MTLDEAKTKLGRKALVMLEASGSSLLDGDNTLVLLEEIYEEFKLELQKEYARGFNDRHTCRDLEYEVCSTCKHWVNEECKLLPYEVEDTEYGMWEETLYILTDKTFGCRKWRDKDE